jgi:hypothetical protein
VDSNPFFYSQPGGHQPANRSRKVMIIVGALIVVGLVAYLECAPKPSVEDIPLTAEAKGYIGNLQLSDVGMKATVDYFSQRVVEIQGSIRNNGDRGLDVVEVTCVFRDGANQSVMRQRAPIVSKKMGGLKPGETKTFRLPFDAVPDAWNRQMPTLVIAGIDFQ